MSNASEPKFRRAFTKDQLRGKHHLTVTPPELNAAFLEECERERRVPSDMIRIMMEDRYADEVRIAKTVTVEAVRVRRGKIHDDDQPGKREVA